MDQILSMLGLAHKAGRVEIGEEPVGSAARAKKARVILIAQDAAPSSQRRAKSFAHTGNCLYLTIPAEKDALGRALGRTSCAMCAVTEIGFAGAIVKKLSQLDPQRNQEASDLLEVKARRAAERKREQLQHEKNLKNGKKRSHSLPDTAEKTAEPATAAKPKAAKTEKPAAVPARRRDAVRKQTDSRTRFAGSLPVKKGKGSKSTSKTRTKVRSDH